MPFTTQRNRFLSSLVLVCVPSLSFAHGLHHHDEVPDFVIKLTALVSETNDPLTILHVCTFILTVLPLILVLVLPKNLPTSVERILVSFALGTMLSEIFLHLLPETLANHSHDHSHDHAAHHSHDHTPVTFGPPLKLLLGFLAFYVVERVMGLIMDVSSSLSSHLHDHHDYHHIDHDMHEGKSSSVDSKPEQRQLKKRNKKSSNSDSSVESKTSDHQHSTLPAASKPVPVPALLHVFATSIHVASDGLLLAMAFNKSLVTGISTFFGLVLHEIPHRLGDWALLQGALGMSHKQAIFAHVWLSVASISGVFAGSYIIPRSALDTLMPIVSGGLLYVATVGVVPELTGGHHHHHHAPSDHHHDSSEHSSSSAFKVTLLCSELAAVAAGVYFMQH